MRDGVALLAAGAQADEPVVGPEVDGGAGNNWGALLGALLIYLVYTLAGSLSQTLFYWVSSWTTQLGWGAIPDIDSRSLQMRVFVLGVVIVLALRYAPKGLIPEVVRRER